MVALLRDPWFWAFIAALGWFPGLLIVGTKALGNSPVLGVIAFSLAQVPRVLLPLPFVVQPRIEEFGPLRLALCIGILAITLPFTFAAFQIVPWRRPCIIATKRIVAQDPENLRVFCVRENRLRHSLEREKLDVIAILVASCALQLRRARKVRKDRQERKAFSSLTLRFLALLADFAPKQSSSRARPKCLTPDHWPLTSDL